MNLIICIDDTDSETSEKGTGAIAEEIMCLVEKKYGAKGTFVTRHQFLIHPDIPYTSHNSAMCFACTVPDNIDMESMISECFDHLKKESAEGSDPGLCVADLAKADAKMLIDYGKECKRKVMTKESAYTVAKDAGVFLDEAGGTGQGVIGAVGGVGLRLWGNDGTLKSKPKGLEGGKIYSVAELLQNDKINSVKCVDGRELTEEESVLLEKKPKISLVDGLPTVLVEKKSDGVWLPMEKNKARWHGGSLVFKEGCSEFRPDVEEEQFSEIPGNNCYNCLYRRWLENGILCQRPYEK